MYVIPSLKLNKFQHVSIPKPAELFARVGMTKKDGVYSGDENVNTPQSKVEQLAEIDRQLEVSNESE